MMNRAEVMESKKKGREPEKDPKDDGRTFGPASYRARRQGVLLEFGVVWVVGRDRTAPNHSGHGTRDGWVSMWVRAAN